jgi:hypothetical protein
MQSSDSDKGSNCLSHRNMILGGASVVVAISLPKNNGLRLLELAGLSLEFLDLVRGRLTRRVASQPLLAGLQKR